VGQCGNQIGLKFWETILEEQGQLAKNAIFSDSLSVFFRNVDSKKTLKVGHEIKNLKARAIIVDTECGVIN
jgi:hypothetical protein